MTGIATWWTGTCSRRTRSARKTRRICCITKTEFLRKGFSHRFIPARVIRPTPRIRNRGWLIIQAIGPRFIAQELATRIQYAEAVAPQTDWNYITPALGDPDLWANIGRISFHNYGTADPYRSYLRD